MKYLEIMKKRYTTKKYDAAYQIPAQLIEELKEILILTPSSINSQPWHFTIISNSEVKQKLSEHSFFNAEKITDCSHLLVLHSLDNPDKFESILESQNASYMLDYYRNMRKNIGDERVRTWFAKQLYIALGVALSACADLGIDATPMEGIKTEEYDRIIGMEDYKVVLAVAMGKHHADDLNQLSKTPKKRMPSEMIFTEIN